MTRQAHRPGSSKQTASGAAAKQRRLLADGPAVRAALALAEEEAKQSDSGGWKLLDASPDSNASSQDGWKLLEVPPETEHKDPCGSASVDSTQPEPSWRVVEVTDPPSSQPDSGAAAKASSAQPRRQAPAVAKTTVSNSTAKRAARAPSERKPTKPGSSAANTSAAPAASADSQTPRTRLSASRDPTPVERARQALAAREAGGRAAASATTTPAGQPRTQARQLKKPAGMTTEKRSDQGGFEPETRANQEAAPAISRTPQVAARSKRSEPAAAPKEPRLPAIGPVTGVPRPHRGITPATGVPRPDASLIGGPPRNAPPLVVPRVQVSPASLLTRPLRPTPARDSIPQAIPLPIPSGPRALVHTQIGVAPPPPPVNAAVPAPVEAASQSSLTAAAQPSAGAMRPPLDSFELDEEETAIMQGLAESENPELAALARTQPGALLPPLLELESAAEPAGPHFGGSHPFAVPHPAQRTRRSQPRPAARAPSDAVLDSEFGAPQRAPEQVASDPALARTQLGSPPLVGPPAAAPEPQAQPFAPVGSRSSPAALTPPAAGAEPQPCARLEPAPGLPAASPHRLDSALAAPSPRAPLSSDAFATTHDTVPPARVAESLPLPGLSWRMSRPRWIGLGSVALIASCIPVALFAAGLSRLIERPPAEAAKEVRTVTRTKPAAHAASNRAPDRAKPATPSGAEQKPGTLAQPPTAPAAQPTVTASAAEPARATQPSPDPAPEPPRPLTAPGDVPWTAQRNKTTPACDALAQVSPAGPKAFLLQKASERGRAELMRGNIEGAHVAFCEASLLGTPPSSVLLGLAQVLLMQADASGALAAVDQLLQQHPDNKRARDMRGDVLIRLGRVEEARQEWFKAAGASRSSNSLINNLLRAARSGARSAARAGDLARADRMLRRVLALDPADVEAAAQLAATLLKSGEPSAARTWLEYARSLDPDHERVTSVQQALSG